MTLDKAPFRFGPPTEIVGDTVKAPVRPPTSRPLPIHPSVVDQTHKQRAPAIGPLAPGLIVSVPLKSAVEDHFTGHANLVRRYATFEEVC